jgi:hypothetical protein
MDATSSPGTMLEECQEQLPGKDHNHNRSAIQESGIYEN